jgi:ParB/RepB/Spo0J family partition protein
VICEPARHDAEGESVSFPVENGDIAAMYVPLSRLHADYDSNTRRVYRGIEELAETIREQGMLNPITARPCVHDKKAAGRLDILAGFRRYKAAELLKLELVPVTIVDVSDRQASLVNLAENIREDPPKAIVAQRCFELSQEGMKPEDIASAIGLSRATTYHYIRVWGRLDPSILKAWGSEIAQLEIPLWLLKKWADLGTKALPDHPAQLAAFNAWRGEVSGTEPDPDEHAAPSTTRTRVRCLSEVEKMTKRLEKKRLDLDDLGRGKLAALRWVLQRTQKI